MRKPAMVTIKCRVCANIVALEGSGMLKLENLNDTTPNESIDLLEHSTQTIE